MGAADVAVRVDMAAVRHSAGGGGFAPHRVAASQSSAWRVRGVTPGVFAPQVVAMYFTDTIRLKAPTVVEAEGDVEEGARPAQQQQELAARP